MVTFTIMTPEEDAEFERRHDTPPEIQAELDKRAAWDKKHPKCGTCGQFLKKNTTDPFGPEWVSHWRQTSYEYNEWDHD